MQAWEVFWHAEHFPRGTVNQQKLHGLGIVYVINNPFASISSFFLVIVYISELLENIFLKYENNK
jgi:hypothetical protein